jgi:hypothetical protein
MCTHPSHVHVRRASLDVRMPSVGYLHCAAVDILVQWRQCVRLTTAMRVAVAAV